MLLYNVQVLSPLPLKDELLIGSYTATIKIDITSALAPTLPHQTNVCQIPYYFFPIRPVGRGTTGERGGGRVEGADDLRMY